MNESKGKVTTYGNNTYMSRLEARWANFLDTLGIPFQYKPKHFFISDPEGKTQGLWYAPDFWLPVQNHWLDVHGLPLSEFEENRICRFIVEEDAPVLVVGTIPKVHPYRSDCEVGEWAYSNMEAYQGYWFTSEGYDFPYLLCECRYCGKLGFEFDGRSERLNCCSANRSDENKRYNSDTIRILWAYAHANDMVFH